MIDLYWADEKALKRFNCSKCPKAQQDRMKCKTDGYEHFKNPIRVDDSGGRYRFCPGKATWSPEIVEVFNHCRVATDTGLLPERGAVSDQTELFVEVFPHFVEKWRQRKYNKVWQDIAQAVEALFKKVGKGSPSKPTGK